MEQTIAAIATAMGEGGIGIVRMSGSESLEILKKIFTYKSGRRADSFEDRRMIYGNIIDGDGSIIDEAMVVFMKAPHSYTGEDVVEIQCHGSIISVRKILSAVLESGAALAERGEFTKRAFLNGRIDLSQAEAVIDIISAVSDAGYDAAVSQLEGSVSGKINAIRTELADLISDIIAHIEYPEEDLEDLVYSDIIRKIEDISSEIKKLYDSADDGKIIKDGIRLAIAGRPNVGKSSLMNLLLKEDRAIVTDIPGTTRDTIEEFISISGIPVRLTDTAGIHDTEDIIEKMGIEKSKKSVKNADIVAFIIDGSQELSDEDFEIMSDLNSSKVIFVINKSDLGIRTAEDDIKKALLNIGIKPEICGFTTISAKNDKDASALTDMIKELVFSGRAVSSDDIIITNVRHADLLKRSLNSLSDAADMLRVGGALDFAETDIRNAWSLLGEIVGETVNQDILKEVFSRFCLGK